MSFVNFYRFLNKINEYFEDIFILTLFFTIKNLFLNDYFVFNVIKQQQFDNQTDAQCNWIIYLMETF